MKKGEAILYHNLILPDFLEGVTLYDFEIKQKINEHATMKLVVFMPPELQERFSLQAIEGKKVKVEYMMNDVKKPLFSGFVTETILKFYNSSYLLELYASSNSLLLDVKKIFRSYQNIKQTFDENIKDALKNHQEANYINEDKKKNDTIGKLMLQWNETDWEYIKRLVSRHFVGLIPSIESEKPAFVIGLPTPEKAKEVLEGRVCTTLNPGAINDKIFNLSIEHKHTSEFLSYKLIKRIEKYDMGGQVLFKGLKWRIGEVKTYLDRNDAVVYFDYVIAFDDAWQQPFFYNRTIQGLSIESSVIDRKKDFTKVHLDIDGKQEIDTASWFRQCTYYTAGNDRGWCAMPELQDRMSLHFPTVEENDCFLIDSTDSPYNSFIYPNVNSSSKAGMNPSMPSSGEDKTNRTIVDSKFMVAPNGQFMLLENGQIQFGSKDVESSLSFFNGHADKSSNSTLGIRLNTTADLNITTPQNISFGDPICEAEKPSKNVFFAAKKDVVLVCQDSSVILNSETKLMDYSAATIDLLPPDDE